jgi:TPR repeat protein
MNLHVLMDVGPVTVPAPCPCITNPFTVPALRPGWGFGDGPAAAEGNAQPSRAERQRQMQRDAEDRKALSSDVEAGLAGNSASTIAVAYHLTTGAIVARNDEEALRWFHLAAEQGHRDAYLQLGHRYHRGLGVSKNDRAAAYWFHEGAVRGDRHAMVALGLLYAGGTGVRQDWSVAARWWERAREGGGPPMASRFLGDAYACGLGVPQDHPRAALAYTEAAKAGEVSSSVQLGHMYASGCVEAEDQAALEAYKRAADRGDPEAQVALSDLYLQARGVPHDPLHAYLWARLAELRLPPGDLRTQAAASAARAARLLSAGDVKDTDRLVEALIADGKKPMR